MDHLGLHRRQTAAGWGGRDLKCSNQTRQPTASSLMVLSLKLHCLCSIYLLISHTVKPDIYMCICLLFFYLLLLFKYDKAGQNRSDRTPDGQRGADSARGAKQIPPPGEGMWGLPGDTDASRCPDSVFVPAACFFLFCFYGVQALRVSVWCGGAWWGCLAVWVSGVFLHLSLATSCLPSENDDP